MASDKLIIQRIPSEPNSNGQLVYIDHNNKSVEVYSSEQALVDFYSSVITTSSIAKDIPTDEFALLRVVSSMFGGTVRSLQDKDFAEQEFNDAVKSLKSKKVTL